MSQMNQKQVQSFIPMMPSSTVPSTSPQAGRGALSRREGIGSSKIKLTILWTLLASFGLASVRLAVAEPRNRRVTVTFNYDFNLNHVCSQALTKNCVKQFNVYDTTDKEPVKLFSIPVPAGAAGFVKGITGTSPPLPLRTGEHILGVTAQAADGTESDSGACTTKVRINP
jgi:hypothetical protein